MAHFRISVTSAFREAKNFLNMKLWNRYTREQKFLYILRWIMGITALTAFICILIDYGFYLSRQQQRWVDYGHLICGFLFLSGYTLQLIVRRDRWKYLRVNHIKYLLSLLIFLEILIVYVFHVNLIKIGVFRGFSMLTFRHPHLLLFQFYNISNVLRWIVKITQYLAQYNASPARFILLSFGSVILTGAGLLMLPKSTTILLHPLDALFTSTSAVCVTGLIVVDTATAFTRMGQLIILGLIQTGGLGIMTVTAFFSLFVGQRMSGREQILLGDMLDTGRLAQLGTIIRAVFLTTITIEACGVGLLYISWREYLPPQASLYTAFFHSISAFCNAGFSTFSDSLMGYATNVKINMTICGLIILGGIGFGTLMNISAFLPLKSSRKLASSLSVQVKLVLVMTACLLTFGTLLFFLLEVPNVLHTFPLKGRILGAFFQSVTFRTAGFNTIDFSKVHESTLMLGILLMFIGAAPGSTAGGIKVTTLAILLTTVISAARGRTRLELFRRTIPETVLYQTLVVITMYLLVAIVVSFLLVLTETGFRPVELLFETVSALGTVGLSTGVTPHLSMIGKVMIIMTMFLGRVGPFTLALAIGQRQYKTERYRYPSERVQIG